MEQTGATQSGNGGGGANSLQPLWRDAVARIVKRETNDLQGAVRRWGLKGQEKRFADWARDFYDKDHPAFIEKQLQPILEAERRLFGRDRRQDVATAVLDILGVRKKEVLESTAESLLDALNTDVYAARAVDQMLDLLRPIAAETDASEDEEIASSGEALLALESAGSSTMTEAR